jgi:iron complex transport system permease protein
MVVAISIGPADITLSDVWLSVGSHLGLPAQGTLPVLKDAIVWELRVPRVLAAAGVGAGLSLCGVAIQALTRNPLADPYLLGLSSGASLGAVAFLLAGAALLMPLGAFLGAAAALGLALVLARMMGSITPSRAILAGLAVSAAAGAMTSLLIFWSSTGDSYREILSWLMGSLAGTTWPDALVATLATLVLSFPILLSARALNGLAFGEAAAATLGIDVAATRWLLLTVTALLTGALVSVSGAIGFVGLVLPHLARLSFGAQHQRLLPAAAIGGAIFMVWADTGARMLFSPREIPVGIITALLGTPVFLSVLVRFRHMT